MNKHLKVLLACKFFLLVGCNTTSNTCRSNECGEGGYVVSSYEKATETGEYQNGRLIQGKVNYPGTRPSSFEGSFQWLKNPNYDTEDFMVPKQGTYTSIFSEQYTGKFHYIHRPLTGAITEARHNGIEGSYGALFIAGTKVDRHGNSHKGIWLAEYQHGKIRLGFVPSSLQYLQMLANYSITNNKNQKQYWQQKEGLVDFLADLLSIAGAASITAHGVNSGLTTDSAAELGAGMYNLLEEGDATALQQAGNNLEYQQSHDSGLNTLKTDADNRKLASSNEQVMLNNEYLAATARSTENKRAMQNGLTASQPTVNSAVDTSSTLTSTSTSTTARVDQPSSTTNKQRTRIDVIKVEAMAYCYQTKKRGTWGCDGPNQRLLLSDKVSIESALDGVHCNFPDLNRNRDFLSEKLPNSEKYQGGVLVYCGKGLEPYDRDIAKIYQVSSSDKKARNTYKCRKNSVKTCTDIHQRLNGLVSNTQEVEVIVSTPPN